MNIQTIKNVSDCVPLYLPHSLYLNPYAKINISVSLPQTVTGKTISNWDVMEKLRKIILPDIFSVLKVTKSTLEFIRLEAEIEELSKLKNVLGRLDGRPIKLAAFSETLKIRATQAKDTFPSRHDWDSFFRDANDMDEMKAGERPDTIHIANIPIRWICPRHLANEENVKPSESIFKRIFEKFGEVRQVDIPICDPYRKDMKAHMTGMKTFSFDQELYFEGYVQFSEYIGFVKTMDAFRAMKLIRKEGDKNLVANIAVDFDRTKHLSDASVKRRKILRERFIARDRAKDEEEKKKQQEEEAAKERERCRKESEKMAELEKQRQREEKRKEKHLKKLREKEQEEMSIKIRNEEKKLFIAQRKLEGIRVLSALFERIKLTESKKIKIKKEDDKSNKHHKKTKIDNKSVDKSKIAQQHEIRKLQNRINKVKSTGGIQAQSPGVNTISSISSDDSVLSDTASAAKKKKKKKVKKRKNSNTSTTSLSTEPEETKIIPAMPPQAAFPMFDPETGHWMGMPIGMYPTPFLPGTSMMRPDLFANPMFPRGMRGRGRFQRSRGRGGYRGRGGGGSYSSYDRGHYDDDDQYDDVDNHRKSRYNNSRSRSRDRRSRSSNRRTKNRSKYNRYRRSRSRSRSSSRHRSRSRSHSRSRSRSKSRHSRSRSRNTKPKLVSTLRKSRSNDRWSSRSRSRSRSRYRSKRSWSKDAESSRHTPPAPSSASVQNKIVLEPEKLVRNAKEIQRMVQEKLMERVRKEDEIKDGRNAKGDDRSSDNDRSNRRSISVDSSKFQSPKRKQQSESPQ